jgi:hypothetical protein
VRRVFSILIGVFLFSASKVTAVQINLSDIPSTISQDSFTITASVSGALSGTNYLRIDLFKEGTSNYFGETYNGGSWISSSDGTQYFPITITSGMPWNGQIQGRVGSPSKTEYDGNGNYKLRVRRYTASGNYNSDEANENIVSIAIVYPTQTPTVAPTTEPTKVPTPTKTPTPSPTKSPTDTPLPTKKVAPTSKVNSTTKESQFSLTGTQKNMQILGEKTSTYDIVPTINLNQKVQVAGVSDISFGTVLVMIGGVFLLACGILAFYTYKKKNT